MFDQTQRNRPYAGIDRMLRAVNRFCQGKDMKLAVEKTVMLTTRPSGTSWKVSENDPSLEALLVGKYLGIDIQVKGREELLLKSMPTQLLDYPGMG